MRVIQAPLQFEIALKATGRVEAKEAGAMALELSALDGLFGGEAVKLNRALAVAIDREGIGLGGIDLSLGEGRLTGELSQRGEVLGGTMRGGGDLAILGRLGLDQGGGGVRLSAEV
ncbi:MAG: hypothetical protein HQL57_08750, partial [Magnetococcales bacterium]|nr:hypothetical protein [Magnetococcales bacterium]